MKLGCLGRSRRRSRTLTTTVAAILLVSCRKAVVCLSSTPLLQHRRQLYQTQRHDHLLTFVRYNKHNDNDKFKTRSILSHLRAGGQLPSDCSQGAQVTMTTTTTMADMMKDGVPHDRSSASAPTTTWSAADKLAALRASLQDHRLDAYLVPSDDPHLSEYTPDAYKRRAFLTNFQGSAGTAVVTKSAALLWTDSRYFNEANLSLDFDHWTLMKQGTPKVPSISAWLAKEASNHWTETGLPFRIGIDPYVHPASFAKEMTNAMEAEEPDAVIAELVTTIEPGNLIDPIWSTSRPPIPTSPFRVHPLQYAGQSVEDKVACIRTQLEERKATLAVFSTLDDVAYLLNLRAMGDVDACPVGLAYATVDCDSKVTLYCDDAKLCDPAVRDHLTGIAIRPYDAIVKDLAEHVQFEKHGDKNRVWMDSSRANLALASAIPEKQLTNAQNAITPMKACKNDAELDGMRQAHVVDGAAMAEFMAWLEATLEDRPVSEVELDEVLTSCRAKQPGFLEVSFPTIAGVGSNGAIIHYRAKDGSELLKYLDKSQPLLLDSGGQYTYGTTDVTRTWHFGTPSDEFKKYYTRVLKGNIGVDTMIFPENTPGFVLDVFARKSLWECGMDYGHGTGHGVGAALNVHEGPHSISPRWGNQEVLKKGMVVSNEPGYYEDGNFGIRIENLLEISHVKPKDSDSQDPDGRSNSKEKTFLKFEKLTLIPIQKNLIDLDLMTSDELDWLDTYHQRVLEKVGPLLEADTPAINWLKKSCALIDRSGVTQSQS